MQIQSISKKLALITSTLLFNLFFLTIPALAADPPADISASGGSGIAIDVTAGLSNISSADLAGKIIKIATGFGALAGAVAAMVLIYLGFKLKVSTEQQRAETKQHIIYVLAGLGLVAFAVLIAGFTANLLKS